MSISAEDCSREREKLTQNRLLIVILFDTNMLEWCLVSTLLLPQKLQGGVNLRDCSWINFQIYVTKCYLNKPDKEWRLWNAVEWQIVIDCVNFRTTFKPTHETFHMRDWNFFVFFQEISFNVSFKSFLLFFSLIFVLIFHFLANRRTNQHRK